MNAKEARKITEGKAVLPWENTLEAIFSHAKGYLEAVGKAKILADTIRAVIENNDGEPYREFCRQAIKEWEEEI